MKNKSKYKILFDNIKPGSIVNGWKILDNFLIIKSRSLHVDCECSFCNKTKKYIQVHDLLNKKTTKCFVCSLKSQGKEYVESYKGILSTVFSNMKSNAKKRNLQFDITIQDIGDLFEKQQGKCNLSGIQLKLKESYIDNKYTASLDRIDSSKGYLKDNIQWVYRDINYMKKDLKQDHFIELCTKIYEKHKQINK